MVIREREVERALRTKVGKAGGLCLKFVSPGWSGAPDRVCLFPGGNLCFVEVKRPGGKVRALQLRRAEQLRRLGFQVEVIDHKEQIPEIIAKFGGDAELIGGGVDAQA